MSNPTVARSLTSNVWHDLNRATGPGASRPWHTMCGRDAQQMFRFNPSDLRTGERSHKSCEQCRRARGV